MFGSIHSHFKERGIIIFTILRAFSFISILVLTTVSHAAVPASSDTEFLFLQEKDLAETVKRGYCIILFEVLEQTGKAGAGKKTVLEASTQPFIKEVMRSVSAFRERIASSVKLYQVRVKDLPGGTAFVTYNFDGAEVTHIAGPFRPDALPWLVHEILGYYIQAIPTEQGEYLRAGWLVIDTNASYINVISERKEEHAVGGKMESVQIITYHSTPGGAASFEVERTYGRDGRLLGSIELYGPYGKFGYFDYDRTGKFQYRIKYPSGEKK